MDQSGSFQVLYKSMYVLNWFFKFENFSILFRKSQPSGTFRTPHEDQSNASMQHIPLL